MELQDSNEQFQNLYNNTLAALFRTKIDTGEIINCNDQMVQIFGFKDQQDAIENYKPKCAFVNLEDRGRIIEQLKISKELHDFEIKYRLNS